MTCRLLNQFSVFSFLMILKSAWIFISMPHISLLLLKLGHADFFTFPIGIEYYYLYVLRHAVAQLVEALPYKPEGRGFDSQ